MISRHMYNNKTKKKQKLIYVELHSHEIPYGSGSGQQSVTAHPSSTDPNSLFIVKEGHGKKPCKIGDIFSDGDLIRLEHSATHRNVHSHNHRSPLSQAQEVSAYSPSGNGNGDSGDTWRIRTSPGGNDEWFRDAPVLFEHVDTGKYLSASTKHKYNNPIPGQLEVSCIDRQSKDTSWFAQQGFYYPANED